MSCEWRLTIESHHADLSFIRIKDRQYASDDFKRVLWASGIVQSMSGTGACWDNTVVESFFKRSKLNMCIMKNFHRGQQQN